MTAGRVFTETTAGNGLAWMGGAIEFPEWATEGLCGQQTDLPPDAWFPKAGPGRPTEGRRTEASIKARAICAECAVSTQCLEYAFETGEEHGIWGGLDQYERRALKSRGAAS